jgi:hypothetical protein
MMGFLQKYYVHVFHSYLPQLRLRGFDPWRTTNHRSAATPLLASDLLLRMVCTWWAVYKTLASDLLLSANDLDCSHSTSF